MPLRPALLAVLCLLAAASPAGAAERPDSDAPPGAPPAWLPAEEWVMERWLPFEEARLHEVLGVDRTEAYFFLRDGDRTLHDLARLRGVPVEGLGERLLAPRRAHVGAALWRVLRARTERVLTQGHLAEHMLGHVFHHWAIWRDPARSFGVARARYEAIEHLAPVEVARRGGLTAARFRRRVLALLAATRAEGVASGALPPAEARAMRSMLAGAIDRWLVARPDLAPAPRARPRSVLCDLR
ncbi:MAG TPA: hypothetical protein VHF89_10475 [Solirubrobacteraceae bacterium]|nr:hypothetical protein [Solirubrobacteraceae bacterium]